MSNSYHESAEIQYLVRIKFPEVGAGRAEISCARSSGKTLAGIQPAPGWSRVSGDRRLLIAGRAGSRSSMVRVPGGEGNLQARRVGSKGRRLALLSMGAGRAKSPCEWSSGDTVEWRIEGSTPKMCHGPGRIQRKARSGPSLARGFALQNTPCE